MIGIKLSPSHVLFSSFFFFMKPALLVSFKKKYIFYFIPQIKLCGTALNQPIHMQNCGVVYYVDFNM